MFAAIAQLDQSANKNMARDRGQFWPEPKGQSLSQGRIAWQAAVPDHPVTLVGILVDGGCANRTDVNLALAPESVAASLATQAPSTAGEMPGASEAAGNAAAAVTAHGISVEDRTLSVERADIMPHVVADARSRIEDPTCAITGATRGYALLLPNGRLLVLNEGGNTMADEAVQTSPAGRAMLNGNAPGLKPRVTVTGWLDGPRLVVEQLKLG